jgi:hypothetical protein
MCVEKGLNLFGLSVAIENDVDLQSAACVATTVVRNCTKSALVCRAVVWPTTVPVWGSSAAYSESVPCRWYSKPCRSARPGDIGNTGSKRSSA